MTENKRRETNIDSERSMNIDVGHLSVTGHVLFAGRDGSIAVNTGGDVEQTNTTTMTVGGVETDRASLDSMVTSIRNAQQTIEQAPLDPNAREAAQHNLNTLETQLTSEQKPNPHILVQAAKSLYKLSPLIAGAIVSIFSEPLAGQIVAGIGGIAIQFYEALMKVSKSEGPAQPAP